MKLMRTVFILIGVFLSAIAAAESIEEVQPLTHDVPREVKSRNSARMRSSLQGQRKSGIAGGTRVDTKSRNLLAGKTKTSKETKGATDIALLMKTPETCKSFPDYMKVCFGDEQGQHGLASCDSKSTVFNEKACCARIVGLKSCISKEVFDICDLGGVVASLHSTGCGVFVPTVLSLESGKVNSTNAELQFLDIEVPDSKSIMTTSYGLSDETLGMYLAYSNSTETVLSLRTETQKIIANETRRLRQTAAGALVVATEAAGVIGPILEFILIVWNDLKLEEARKREAFTIQAVTSCRTALPDFTCVIVYDQIPHQVNAIDYGVQYRFLKVDCCRGYGYYLYYFRNFKPFTFVRNGAGSFVNWAVSGNYNYDGVRTVTNDINFNGARVYEHANAGGIVSYLWGNTKYNYGSFGNDVISSTDVDWNCCMTAYEHDYWQGAAVFFCNGYYPYLGNDWNDRMSSASIQCWYQNFQTIKKGGR